jgi:FixJ family two-component response regulator
MFFAGLGIVKREQFLKARVVFVDDDLNLCKTVSRSLEHRGLRVRYFTNGCDCLKDFGYNHCDLLITEVRMPGMDGVTLLKQVKDSYPWVAVLVATGYGDIPLAKEVFKCGATDLIEKPLTTENLMSAVESAMARSRQYEGLAGSALTPAESRVLALMMKDMNNREIADVLRRSVRTVEVHSGRIYKKFGVSNRIELVRRATEMRFAKDRQGQ